jgi:hypothetical protein
LEPPDQRKISWRVLLIQEAWGTEWDMECSERGNLRQTKEEKRRARTKEIDEQKTNQAA